MTAAASPVARAAGIDRWLQTAAAGGTPAYVYFAEPIAKRIARLRAAFGNRFALSFAAKANPNPAVLAWMRDRVEYLDVSSVGELRIGRAAGWDAVRASFTGPGKREAELWEAMECGLGELVIESQREAEVASDLAQGLGRVQDVLLRISPSRVPKGFGDQMAGRPSPFGIDVETMHETIPHIAALPGLRIVGVHIYSGTQCLMADAICENYRIFIDVFREACCRHDLRPEKLVFGSGLGIAYHPGNVALDLEAVGESIGPDLDAILSEPRFRGARLVLELGRYLVGEAGYFLTRVIATKESRGTRIAVCDGGMNNHLPASGHFGMVIHRNYAMHRVGGGDGGEPINLVGPLCTSIDRLASGVLLPPLAPGDLIAVHGSGAYGLTASPLLFISHPIPREVWIDGDNLRDISYFGERGLVLG